MLGIKSHLVTMVQLSGIARRVGRRLGSRIGRSTRTNPTEIEMDDAVDWVARRTSGEMGAVRHGFVDHGSVPVNMVQSGGTRTVAGRQAAAPSSINWDSRRMRALKGTGALPGIGGIGYGISQISPTYTRQDQERAKRKASKPAKKDKKKSKPKKKDKKKDKKKKAPKKGGGVRKPSRDRRGRATRRRGGWL